MQNIDLNKIGEYLVVEELFDAYLKEYKTFDSYRYYCKLREKPVEINRENFIYYQKAYATKLFQVLLNALRWLVELPDGYKVVPTFNKEEGGLSNESERTQVVLDWILTYSKVLKECPELEQHFYSFKNFQQ